MCVKHNFFSLLKDKMNKKKGIKIKYYCERRYKEMSKRQNVGIEVYNNQNSSFRQVMDRPTTLSPGKSI